MLPEADHFLEECEELASLLETLAPEDWSRPTLFKAWTPDDVMVHLHFWNRAADLSLRDSAAFLALLAQVVDASAREGLRACENRMIVERGADLYRAWRTTYREMAPRWRALDPSIRLKWGGPEMSARSSISARQMETWSHAQALFDLFGRARRESDRLRNIVVLGVNTFGWSFKVRGEAPPTEPPRISLVSPQGALWEFNATSVASSVGGSAVEFCQVVAQTRNIADTSLRVAGDAAVAWMRHPQCFAGPSETPPPPGARTSGVNWRGR